LTDLGRPDPLHLSPGQRLEAERLYVRSLELQRAGTPANTRRAYEGDWQRFSNWCDTWGHRAIPAAPQTVILYVTYLADPERPRAARSRAGGCKPATIDRAVAAISHVHRLRGYVSPRESIHVRGHVQKVKNVLKTAPEEAPPLLVRHLEKIVAHLPATEPLALRDKALILVGWAGALRRSELAALDRSDAVFTPEGLMLRIRSSKADQEGEGSFIPIEPATNPDLCPVDALRAWLEAADSEPNAPPRDPTSPLFLRTYYGALFGERIEDREVNDVIKRRAARASITPDQPGVTWSGHSLRSGFITAAAQAGRPEWQIMSHSRHKSYESFRRYIRKANLFQDNPGRGLL
jgi:integrase